MIKNTGLACLILLLAGCQGTPERMVYLTDGNTVIVTRYGTTFAKENQIDENPAIVIPVPKSYEDKVAVCGLGHEVMHAMDANLGRHDGEAHDWKGLGGPVYVRFWLTPKQAE